MTHIEQTIHHIIKQERPDLELQGVTIINKELDIEHAYFISNEHGTTYIQKDGNIYNFHNADPNLLPIIQHLIHQIPHGCPPLNPNTDIDQETWQE